MSRCCAPSSVVQPRAGAAKAFISRAAQDEDWIHIEGGASWIGSNDPEGFASDGEGPARRIHLSPYRIRATAVTNSQFAAFVQETGYRTEAEEAGESFVFYLQIAPQVRAQLRRVVPDLPWWMIVPGASWRSPHGAGSDWQQRPNHPVVHVSWNDAMAYCSSLTATEAAAGRIPAGYQYRLPTEAEWEYVCRAGTTTEWNTGGNLSLPMANFGSGFAGQTTVVGSYCGYSPQTDLTDFGLDLTSWALVLALAFEPGPPREHAGCKQHSTLCLPPLHTTGAWY